MNNEEIVALIHKIGHEISMMEWEINSYLKLCQSKSLLRKGYRVLFEYLQLKNDINKLLIKRKTYFTKIYEILEVNSTENKFELPFLVNKLSDYSLKLWISICRWRQLQWSPRTIQVHYEIQQPQQSHLSSEDQQVAIENFIQELERDMTQLLQLIHVTKFSFLDSEIPPIQIITLLLTSLPGAVTDPNILNLFFHSKYQHQGSHGDTDPPYHQQQHQQVPTYYKNSTEINRYLVRYEDLLRHMTGIILEEYSIGSTWDTLHQIAPLSLQHYPILRVVYDDVIPPSQENLFHNPEKYSETCQLLLAFFTQHYSAVQPSSTSKPSSSGQQQQHSNYQHFETLKTLNEINFSVTSNPSSANKFSSNYYSPKMSPASFSTQPPQFDPNNSAFKSRPRTASGTETAPSELRVVTGIGVKSSTNTWVDGNPQQQSQQQEEFNQTADSLQSHNGTAQYHSTSSIPPNLTRATSAPAQRTHPHPSSTIIKVIVPAYGGKELFLHLERKRFDLGRSKLFIKGFLHGCSQITQQECQIGDEILEINGVNVAGKKVREITKAIQLSHQDKLFQTQANGELKPYATRVSLKLKRHDDLVSSPRSQSRGRQAWNPELQVEQSQEESSRGKEETLQASSARGRQLDRQGELDQVTSPSGKVESPRAQDDDFRESIPSMNEDERDSNEYRVSEYEQSVEEVNPIDQPEAETPVMDQPKEETPVVDQPKAETPVMDEPEAETPVMDQLKAETPVMNEPKAETPVVDEPKAETPVMDQLKAETPVVDEPKAETPVVDEPEAETPVINEAEAEDADRIVIDAGNDLAEEKNIEEDHDNDSIENLVSPCVTNESIHNPVSVNIAVTEDNQSSHRDSLVSLAEEVDLESSSVNSQTLQKSHLPPASLRQEELLNKDDRKEQCQVCEESPRDEEHDDVIEIANTSPSPTVVHQKSASPAEIRTPIKSTLETEETVSSQQSPLDHPNPTDEFTPNGRDNNEVPSPVSCSETIGKSPLFSNERKSDTSVLSHVTRLSTNSDSMERNSDNNTVLDSENPVTTPSPDQNESRKRSNTVTTAATFILETSSRVSQRTNSIFTHYSEQIDSSPSASKSYRKRFLSNVVPKVKEVDHDPRSILSRGKALFDGDDGSCASSVVSTEDNCDLPLLPSQIIASRHESRTRLASEDSVTEDMALDSGVATAIVAAVGGTAYNDRYHIHRVSGRSRTDSLRLISALSATSDNAMSPLPSKRQPPIRRDWFRRLSRAFPSSLNDIFDHVLMTYQDKDIYHRAAALIAAWWKITYPYKLLSNRLKLRTFCLEIVFDVLENVTATLYRSDKLKYKMMRHGAASQIQRIFRLWKITVLMNVIKIQVTYRRYRARKAILRLVRITRAALRVARWLLRWKLQMKQIIGKKKLYRNVLRGFLELIGFRLREQKYKKEMQKVPPRILREATRNGILFSMSSRRNESLLLRRYVTATKIQAIVRGKLARLRYEELLKEREIQRKVTAAMILIKFRKKVLYKREKVLKCLVIQRWWRGTSSRLRLLLQVLASFVIHGAWKRHRQYWKLKRRLRRNDYPIRLTLHEITNLPPSSIETGSIKVIVSVWWSKLLHLVEQDDYLTIMHSKPPNIIRMSSYFPCTETKVKALTALPSIPRMGGSIQLQLQEFNRTRKPTIGNNISGTVGFQPKDVRKISMAQRAAALNSARGPKKSLNAADALAQFVKIHGVQGAHIKTGANTSVTDVHSYNQQIVQPFKTAAKKVSLQRTTMIKMAAGGTGPGPGLGLVRKNREESDSSSSSSDSEADSKSKRSEEEEDEDGDKERGDKGDKNNKKDDKKSDRSKASESESDSDSDSEEDDEDAFPSDQPLSPIKSPVNKSLLPQISKRSSLAFDKIGRECVNSLGANLLSQNDLTNEENSGLPAAVGSKFVDALQALHSTVSFATDLNAPPKKSLPLKPLPKKENLKVSRSGASSDPLSMLGSLVGMNPTKAKLGDQNVLYNVNLQGETLYIPGCHGNSVIRFDIYDGL
jgi:hypothetical protein